MNDSLDCLLEKTGEHKEYLIEREMSENTIAKPKSIS